MTESNESAKRPVELSNEEIPEPPEGADPDIWYSITPEVHQEASQVARTLLGVQPRSSKDQRP